VRDIGRRGRGTGAAGAESPGALRGIVAGVYTKIGGDMVAQTFAYLGLSEQLAEAVFERRKAALSFGFESSVLLAMMLSRCGTR
jgi:hypothetical protein